MNLNQEVMKINKNDIPVTMEAPGTIMRAYSNFGNMTVAFNELPKGTDMTPLLQGLEHDSCQCPHWGYVLAGSMLIRYDDGKEELLREGDVCYLPPGHTAVVQEDFKFIDFSPTREFNQVMEHIGKRMTELAG